MDVYAVAASSGPGLSGQGVLIVLAAAAGWVGWQVVAAKVWPFARCRRCDGSGRNAGSTGKRWGTCRRCKGSGKRRRLAVRLFVSRKD